MKFQKDNKGFTLIEVLIALAVLSIVIIPLTGMFSSSSHINLKSGKDTMAMTVANDIMNRIKAGELTNFDGTEKAYYQDNYGVELLVEPANLENISELQEVKVYVAPDLGRDPTEGVVLSSYINKTLLAYDNDETDDENNGETDPGQDEDDPTIPEDDYWDWYDDYIKNNTNGWPNKQADVMPLYIHDTQNGNKFVIEGKEIHIKSVRDSIKLLYEVIRRGDSNGNGKVNPAEFTTILKELCNISFNNNDLVHYSR